MKVLITGGAGFIGSHTTEALLKRGDEVVCLDNFNDYYDPNRKRKNVAHFRDSKGYALYEADIRDAPALEEIFAREKVDKVLHIAAMAGVRYSLQRPALYAQVNVEGTVNVLECARRFGVREFIFASSSSVYGARSQAPFREDDPVERPISPYAATKRAAELLVYTYHHLYGLKCTILRFFTVYGPWGRPDMAPYLFTKAIYEGTELFMFGDGTSRRDYTYIDDIVSGVVAALDSGLDFEIINLGNSQTIGLRDFIALLEELLGRKARIVPLPEQPGDVPLTCADITKARRLLGYEPSTSVREGMALFVEWYRHEA
ncbi:MAG: NAD-dependent epimerase/dehydratase family protein [Anaerolineae bacterium]